MRSRQLLLFILLAVSSPAFANFSQAHWRWRKDNGSEKKATALSPQDYPVTQPFKVGVTNRIRLEVYNILGNNEAGIVTLEYQRGGAGAWTMGATSQFTKTTANTLPSCGVTGGQTFQSPTCV